MKLPNSILLPGVVIVLCNTACAQATFVAISIELSGYAVPLPPPSALSGDGKVIVGMLGSGAAYRPYRWTENGGLEVLNTQAYALAVWITSVSYDGSAVVGGAVPLNGSPDVVFRWSDEDGWLEFAGLSAWPGYSVYAFAEDVSADGSILVGKSDSFNVWEAFRWSQDGGIIGLVGSLGVGYDAFETWAYAVSGDGTCVVGNMYRKLPGGSNQNDAFRWTTATGIQAIGELPELVPSGLSFYAAEDANADGSIVVGSGQMSDGSPTAIRWVDGVGMHGLRGALPGGANFTSALAVSYDGRVVVGQSTGTGGLEACIWTEDIGSVSLRELLVSHGVSGLDGWVLRDVRAISGDGTTIAGAAVDGVGRWHAYIATLPMTRPCIGDANGDSDTTSSDFVVLAGSFGQSVVPGTLGDLNEDGVVNAGDFVILAGDFGCAG
jgi:uncharacterized membrane protein